MAEIQEGETRPVPIQAMQMVTIEDAAAVGKFMNLYKVQVFYYDKHAILYPTIRSTEAEAPVIREGWWVVKLDGDAKFYIHNDEKFHATYTLEKKTNAG